MTNADDDTGALMAIVQNWDTQTRPRLEKIKASVDSGGPIAEVDLEFLEQIHAQSGRNEALFDRNPEYKRLLAMAVRFYKEIIDRALENERNAQSK